ncbi:aminotransferase class V-fold PLP-dependent enzyme [Sphingopyxis lindanitolerans]|uniref:aminotransferase class V-fold PLP-dependent enzyme n=1 Tax=Sphingopyxis lindanitolerans TaxID=2054227 RepID=UPI003B832FB7
MAAGLGLGPGRGVVSDSLHYDGALVLYGELAKRGMPLKVLAPRNHKIDYDELDKAITSDTKLVAVSHVSSWTGFKHDLKRVCEIAHAKGALVYADVIQSVGAIPLDVKERRCMTCPTLASPTRNSPSTAISRISICWPTPGCSCATPPTSITSILSTVSRSRVMRQTT